MVRGNTFETCYNVKMYYLTFRNVMVHKMPFVVYVKYTKTYLNELKQMQQVHRYLSVYKCSSIGMSGLIVNNFEMYI